MVYIALKQDCGRGGGEFVGGGGGEFGKKLQQLKTVINGLSMGKKYVQPTYSNKNRV